jgi:hypothetical protein
MCQTASKLQKYFLYISTTLSTILNTLRIVALAKFCIPAEKIWNSSVPGHYMSLLALEIGLTQACMRGPIEGIKPQLEILHPTILPSPYSQR